METKTNINCKYNFYGLDLLIKGSLFLWLYRAFGITTFLSFPTLFTAVLVEVIVLALVLIICAIGAFIAATQMARGIKSEVENHLEAFNDFE